MHRVFHVLSVALITAGLVILADVGITLAWKEPVSSIYGSLRQAEAEDQLTALENRFPNEKLLARVARTKDLSEQIRLLADAFEREAKPGQGIGRIEIPAIRLDAVVVEGSDITSLQRGPGHYSPSDDPARRALGDGSAFPGQGETVGIAGHRTTYLAPFRRIDEISRGDEITLRMPYATLTYEVARSEIVGANAIEVVENTNREQLVLTACHPLYSAAQRYVQFADLKEISLFAGGERRWQHP